MSVCACVASLLFIVINTKEDKDRNRGHKPNKLRSVREDEEEVSLLEVHVCLCA